MSTQYVGKAANVPAFPSPIALSSIIPGPPAQIRTVTAHGLSTGQLVTITGETVGTQVNGTWPVTVLDATHFTINVTATANASPVSFVQPLALPTVQTVSDGDDLTASNLNPVGEASQDELAFLSFCTGAYKLTDLVKVTRNFSGLGTSYGTIATTLTNTDYISTMGYELSVLDVQANDILEVDASVVVSGPTSGKIYALSLYRNNTVPGAAVSAVRIAGAGKTWTQVTGGDLLPITIKAYFKIVNTGICQVAIFGMTNNAADTITFYDDETIVAKLYRPTTVPQ